MFTAKTIAFNYPFLKIVSNIGQIHYSPVLLYSHCTCIFMTYIIRLIQSKRQLSQAGLQTTGVSLGMHQGCVQQHL